MSCLTTFRIRNKSALLKRHQSLSLRLNNENLFKIFFLTIYIATILKGKMLWGFLATPKRWIVFQLSKRHVPFRRRKSSAPLHHHLISEFSDRLKLEIGWTHMQLVFSCLQMGIGLARLKYKIVRRWWCSIRRFVLKPQSFSRFVCERPFGFECNRIVLLMSHPSLERKLNGFLRWRSLWFVIGSVNVFRWKTVDLYHFL